jgi:4-hydroxy-3-methylbut-2-enyl diphosphate reductase
MMKPALKVMIASPRGFCAGVDRAIQIVRAALERFGPPVYVRHEIVHNRYVVQDLEAAGAIFVEELEDVPGDAPVVFSAHGVPKSVPADARARNIFYLDATCPLVSKVHREAERHQRLGRHIILIGHAGHPEVVGTMGQLPDGWITLVESAEDAWSVSVPDDVSLAYITQTTLSVDDTAEIVAVLQKRFPSIASPRKEDICYATTNRQEAVKEIATHCDVMLVIGAPNSSNSVRLVEVAGRYGCPGYLVQRAADIDWTRLNGADTVGITAGASAPEILVQEVLSALRARYDISIEEVRTTEESIRFKLPTALTA